MQTVVTIEPIRHTAPPAIAAIAPALSDAELLIPLISFEAYAKLVCLPFNSSPRSNL